MISMFDVLAQGFANVLQRSERRTKGPNEKRIEDDLWGACRCWRNNIIVNFADCGIVGVYWEVGPSSKRANNEGVVCVYSRSSLSSYIFSEQTSRYTERGDAPRREGTRNDSKNEKRMAGW